jgi:hypothetical protein
MYFSITPSFVFPAFFSHTMTPANCSHVQALLCPAGTAGGNHDFKAAVWDR